MSLASLLSIARGAMLTQQKALETTGHNIANAATPGYSRQRLTIQPAPPLRTPDGLVGRGVMDLGAARLRDIFADDAWRRSAGGLGTATTLKDMLARVESAIGEPSDTGLGAALDGLFDAFANLAVAPSDATARATVRQAGRQVANLFHSIDGAIGAAIEDGATELRSQVGQVNLLSGQVAELNKEILVAGGPRGNAGDLQDRRDQLLDQLASSIGARILRRDDGSVAVLAGDTVLVDGGYARTLQVAAAGAGYQLQTADGSAVRLGSGSVKGYLDLVNTGLPALRTQLDALAAAIVGEVNTVHRTGTTPGGVTNTDFFDAAGTTAGTIALTAAIEADPRAIAAGATANAGDGAVALQLAQLRGRGLAALGGATAGGAWVTLVAGLGTQVSEAGQRVEAEQALVDYAEQRRASTSGVSTDEELVALLGQQQAFAAAAKLVTAADEMMQSVLAMV